MKIKSVSSLFCAVAFFGTASVAMAGAYGEAEQAEEMPRPAPVAQEVTESDEFSPFPYIAVGGIFAKEFFGGDVHQINDTYGWGWNARVGYRFSKMVAVELLGEHVVEFDSDGGDGLSTDRRAWQVTPQVKIFPIEGFAEPFISVGGGLFRGDHGHNVEVINAIPVNLDTNPEATENLRPGDSGVDQGYGFSMRFGGGVDLYATDNLFVEAEVAYNMALTGEIHNYDYLSVGLGIGYAFN